MKYFSWKAVAVLVIVLFLGGCSGPEAKKQKYLAKGKTLYEKGDYVKAALELKNALQIDPKFADAYFLMGRVEMKKGNFGGAYGNLSKAVELNPNILDAQAELAKLFLMKRDRVKAQEKVSLILKEKPDHEDANLLQAALYLTGNEPQKAVSLLRTLQAKGVANPDLYSLLSNANRQLNDLKGAEAALLDGIKANPKNLALQRELTQLYVGLRRFDDAAARINTIIALEPDSFANYISLATLYWGTGQEAKGKAALQQVTTKFAAKEDALYNVAVFYISHALIPEAEQVLTTGIAANTKSFKLRFLLSELYLNTKRGDKGLALLKECLTLEKDQENPKIIETKNALAKIYLTNGDLKEAERLTDEIFKKNTRNYDAHLTRGKIHLLRGEGAKAVAAFRVIVTDRPEQPQGFLLLAEAHLANNEMNLALENLQQAEKLDKNSRDLQRSFARYHALKKEFPQAEQRLRTVLAKSPQDLEVMTELGDILVAAGNLPRAEAQYSAVKKTEQGAIAGRLKLARLYGFQSKADRAVAELEQASRLAPQDQEVFAQLSGFYISQRKFDQAAALAQERIARNPKDVAALVVLAESFAARGDTRKAEEQFLKAAAASANATAIQQRLAQLYITAGEAKKAFKLYEELTAKQPENWSLANDYAFQLTDHGDGKGDLDKALALARKAAENRPDDPLILDTLGWVLYKKGDYGKAAENLEKAAARLPQAGVVRYHAGMAQLKLNRNAEAKKHLQSAAASREEFTGKSEAQASLKRL